MAPAIDEENIYLSIRETTAGRGALVAVSRVTFTERWRAPLSARANTNPLVLTGEASAVIVGDVNGQIYAFDRSSGHPVPLFRGQDAEPIYKLAGLDVPLDQLGQSYQTLTGLMEPILASGSSGKPLLITGVSGSRNGKPTGYLIAYGTLPSLDVAWTKPTLDPIALTPGEPYTGTADAILLDGPETSVSVQFYWKPTEGAPVPLPTEPAQLTLKPGQPQTVQFTLTPGPVGGEIFGVINPHAVLPTLGEVARTVILPAYAATEAQAAAVATELFTPTEGSAEPVTKLGNNVTRGSVVVAAPDLAVRIETLPTFACMGAKEATVVATNAGKLPSESWLTVRVGEANLLVGVHVLQPGANRFSVMPGVIGCGTSARLVAEVRYVNPDFVETNTANNQAAATVQVGEPPSIDGAGEIHIMLPADCEINPDWTSPMPCLNYPGLIVEAPVWTAP